MKDIQFPEWAQVLAQLDLPERQKASWTITLNWYLNFCRRGRSGVTIESARDFIQWAEKQKHPQPWQLESWKEAIRWFFREASGRTDDRRQMTEDGGRKTEDGTLQLRNSETRNCDEGVAATPNKSGVLKGAMPEWKGAFLTVVRRRHYSYRTEQSYLVWLQRFARFCKSEDLQGRGPDDIKAFLDDLALNERLSASSQRQALNTVVFLLREVFGKELGDFSDYRRAKVRTHAPTWLTLDEIRSLLSQLPGSWALITCAAFGGGLRLMELLRLRVKDVDLEQEIITVRGGKGDKDRRVPLAHVVVEPLRKHFELVRQIYEGDRREKVAGVWLPDGLERKYPKAGEEWPWFWMWPDDHLSVDPRGGLQRRHHASD